MGTEKCAENTFPELGATQLADVIRRANRQFPARRKELHSVWNNKMDGFFHGYEKRIFDVFDREYYTLMKNDKQLYTLISTYIKQHPSDFLIPAGS
ncbi:MAG TPA: DUF4375 domain-containing protein [Candidatus Phocaeicola gallinarum]|nr:DUF4375 domain-containing protein [Candidatus Phocaeicola gallinarum]